MSLTLWDPLLQGLGPSPGAAGPGVGQGAGGQHSVFSRGGFISRILGLKAYVWQTLPGRRLSPRPPRGAPSQAAGGALCAGAESPRPPGPGLHFPACLGAPLKRHFPVCGASAASALTRPSRGRRGVEAVSGRGAPWGGLGGRDDP